MIKCLIFDCDGTLVDSEYLCYQAIDAVLRPYNIYEDILDMMGLYRGKKLTTIFESLEQKHQVEFDDDFADNYRQKASELLQAHLQPVNGVTEILNSTPLSKCVASNGPQTKMREVLTLTNLLHHFGKNLFSAYDIESWKPEPDLFLHTASEMGFKPQECLVIEDSIVGIQAANAANIPSVLYNPKSISIDGLDTISIGSMLELKTLIQS